MKTNHDNLAARFLLGKLSEEESVGMEKDYFGNQKLFEEILIAENDLIDAYATDTLSTEDKRRFESRLLLSAEQRQRVEFAKTLVEYASSQPLFAEESSAAKLSLNSLISRLFSNRPLLSFSFAAAALILFAAAVWVISNKSNYGSRQDEIAVAQSPPIEQANQNEARNTNKIIEQKPRGAASLPTNQASLPPEKLEKPQKKEPPVVFSLILSPGLTRSDGTSQRFAVPPNTDVVKMHLKFEQGGFSSYQATLETVEGRQVWNGKLKAQKDARSLEISIPSKLLKKSDYILTLRGITKDGVYERVEDYAFTIYR